MIIPRTLVGALPVLVAVAPAHAAEAIYADRAAFEAAEGSVILLDCYRCGEDTKFRFRLYIPYSSL